MMNKPRETDQKFKQMDLAAFCQQSILWIGIYVGRIAIQKGIGLV